MTWCQVGTRASVTTMLTEGPQNFMTCTEICPFCNQAINQFWESNIPYVPMDSYLGAVSIRKTVLPGMAIPMLKIRRPLGRLIFNMGIAIPDKTVFLIETAPCCFLFCTTTKHPFWNHSLTAAEWHIYALISKLTSIGSHNGLLPGQGQVIIWTNAGILLIGHLGINFSEILIEINAFSFKKMHLKMSSGRRRPFCLGLNVLSQRCVVRGIALYRDSPTPRLCVIDAFKIPKPHRCHKCCGPWAHCQNCQKSYNLHGRHC